MVGSAFFSSDVANSDTYTHVYCDMEMLMITMASPGPRVSGIRKGLSSHSSEWDNDLWQLPN